MTRFSVCKSCANAHQTSYFYLSLKFAKRDVKQHFSIYLNPFLVTGSHEVRGSIPLCSTKYSQVRGL